MTDDRDRSELELMRHHVAEFQDRSRKLNEELSRLEHVEYDDTDGFVGVQLSAHGTLLNIKISDEAHESLAPDELAARLLDVVRRGTAAVEAKVLATTAEVYGTGFTPGQLRRGEADFAEVAAAARQRLRS